ncbi:hypothetical protein [Mycolicibacter hiberniae]|uniref:hypothetical protein n=1 Tax=Mycolicibacter hiberniae TaxID=29314 RepID=UPI0010549850|nr:hypothetical protein [Mycolicibacter hiberniae]MCV7087640.1 hypothetical protein [Mycolicibacter hiberniae]
MAGLLLGCGAIAIYLYSRNTRPRRARGRIIPPPGKQQGEELLNNPLSFRTCAALESVAERLISDITPYRQDPGTQQLYLAAAEPVEDSAAFVLIFRTPAEFGPRCVMEQTVVLTPSGGGTSGSLVVEAWQTVDGAMDSVAVQTARAVRAGVRTAIARLDSAAEFSDNV